MQKEFIDKVVCVGKNYLDHMIEMQETIVAKPVLFLKPASTIKQAGNWQECLIVDLISDDVNYECELVLKIKTKDKKDVLNVSIEEAQNMIEKYTVGLDLTLRDTQTKLKKAGHPWTIAKVFKDAAVLAPWLDFNEKSFNNFNFSLELGKTVKQQATLKDMLMKPYEIISYISTFFPLCDGDVIYTGTPSGVGKLNADITGNLQINGHQLNFKTRNYVS